MWPSLEEASHWGRAFRVSPTASCPLGSQWLCFTTLPPPWCLPPPRRRCDGSQHPDAETSETRNQVFLSLSDYSQVFYCSGRSLMCWTVRRGTQWPALVSCEGLPQKEISSRQAFFFFYKKSESGSWMTQALWFLLRFPTTFWQKWGPAWTTVTLELLEPWAT